MNIEAKRKEIDELKLNKKKNFQEWVNLLRQMQEKSYYIK